MYEKLSENLDLWFILLGLPAQVAFTARFLVQWIASERKKSSIIPVAFWYLSIAGSLGLLAYGLIRGEPVLIIGQFFGSIVYLRNLTLIARQKRQVPMPESGVPGL